MHPSFLKIRDSCDVTVLWQKLQRKTPKTRVGTPTVPFGSYCLNVDMVAVYLILRALG